MNFKRVLVVVLLSCFIVPAVAQASSLKGSVSDKWGMVIPGVSVTATNETNSETYTGVSNETGAFRISDVAPGQYSIQTKTAGFKSTTLSNVTVKAGKDTSVKLTIEIGKD